LPGGQQLCDKRYHCREEQYKVSDVKTYLYKSTPHSLKRRSSEIFWHVIGCITFLIVPILFSPHPAHVPLFSRPTFRDVLANFLMLIIFYLNYYIFIPKLYFKKRNVSYGLIISIGFLAIFFLPGMLTGHLPWERPIPPPFEGGPPHRMHPDDNFSFFNPVKHGLFLYVGVILFSILLRVRTKLLETESLKHDAEIGTLKNQINPHFLFNTLNNIYAFAIREKAVTTASTILKLSGMMRYVVTETHQEFVPLQKEIDYTNDYIDLQRMRVTETLHLDYSVTGEIQNQKIAPVILMPFIENAFKHGVNPDEQSSIRISIQIKDDSLDMVIDNKKVKIAQEQYTKSGVGIENTRARLDHLYPKKYILSINDSDDHYRVKLTLLLT
jgi:hypothetical protein